MIPDTTVSNIVSLQDYRRRKSPPSPPQVHPKSLGMDSVIYTMSRQILDMTILIGHLGEQLSTVREENETLRTRMDAQRKVLAALVERLSP